MDGSRSVYHQSTGTGAGGIAATAKAEAKAEAKARAEARAAKAKAEAEDLAEARRIAAAAVYGGEEAWSRMPAALRRGLLVDAWLLMHAPAEERATREKRQRAAGADPASVPLEKTLKNQWRNEREKVGRQGKILAFGYAITVAALAGEAAEIAEAARSRPLPALAEFTAFGAFASAGGAS